MCVHSSRVAGHGQHREPLLAAALHRAAEAVQRRQRGGDFQLQLAGGLEGHQVAVADDERTHRVRQAPGVEAPVHDTLAALGGDAVLPLAGLLPRVRRLRLLLLGCRAPLAARAPLPRRARRRGTWPGQVAIRTAQRRRPLIPIVKAVLVRLLLPLLLLVLLLVAAAVLELHVRAEVAVQEAGGLGRRTLFALAAQGESRYPGVGARPLLAVAQPRVGRVVSQGGVVQVVPGPVAVAGEGGTVVTVAVLPAAAPATAAQRRQRPGERSLVFGAGLASESTGPYSQAALRKTRGVIRGAVFVAPKAKPRQTYQPPAWRPRGRCRRPPRPLTPSRRGRRGGKRRARGL